MSGRDPRIGQGLARLRIGERQAIEAELERLAVLAETYRVERDTARSRLRRLRSAAEEISDLITDLT